MSQFITRLQCIAIISSTFAGTALNDFLHISDPLLATPYEFDPLGDIIEGNIQQPGGKHKPLSQTKSTDCVVFVDDVLSKIYANNEQEITENRQHLRYNSKPYHWFNRNHFTETQWLPAAQKFLTPYAPIEKTRLITQPHNASAWWNDHYTKALKITTLTPEQDQAFHKNIHTSYPSHVTLRYWPWSSIFDKNVLKHDFQPLQSHGWAVVLCVRKNWPTTGTPPTKLLISHMGFIWNKHGELLFRHASVKKGIVDVNFTDYFKENINNPTWAGLIILHPKESKSSQA